MIIIGKKVKVSLFLQQNNQLSDGTLVLNENLDLPCGTQSPGTIYYYENEKMILKKSFPRQNSNNYSETDRIIDCSSNLGENVYSTAAVKHHEASKNMIDCAKEFSAAADKNTGKDSNADSKHSDRRFMTSSFSGPIRKTTAESAKAEMNLLGDLLGVSGQGSKGTITFYYFACISPYLFLYVC